ncbi:hypothetical protein KI387_006906, partial [Taxus chinensis]
TVLITDMDNIVSTWPRQGTPVPSLNIFYEGKKQYASQRPPQTLSCLQTHLPAIDTLLQTVKTIAQTFL